MNRRVGVILLAHAGGMRGHCLLASMIISLIISTAGQVNMKKMLCKKCEASARDHGGPEQSTKVPAWKGVLAMSA
jgi:hypothetical protein